MPGRTRTCCCRSRKTSSSECSIFCGSCRYFRCCGYRSEPDETKSVSHESMAEAKEDESDGLPPEVRRRGGMKDDEGRKTMTCSQCSKMLCTSRFLSPLPLPNRPPAVFLPLYSFHQRLWMLMLAILPSVASVASLLGYSFTFCAVQSWLRMHVALQRRW